MITLADVRTIAVIVVHITHTRIKSSERHVRVIPCPAPLVSIRREPKKRPQFSLGLLLDESTEAHSSEARDDVQLHFRSSRCAFPAAAASLHGPFGREATCH